MENKDWAAKMENLLRRRAINDIKRQPIIDDYEKHISEAVGCGAIRTGYLVLDVGCGEGRVRQIIQGLDGVLYRGIDPFPVDDATEKIDIEAAPWPDDSFDTSICFAVLDGTKDLDVALSQINRISKESVVILTGIGIKPDQCHTFEISLDILDSGLDKFERSLTKWLHPKVALLIYMRKQCQIQS